MTARFGLYTASASMAVIGQKQQVARFESGPSTFESTRPQRQALKTREELMQYVPHATHTALVVAMPVERLAKRRRSIW